MNTFPGGTLNHGLIATNVNPSIIPANGLPTTDRVLLADATISASPNNVASLRDTYSYINIPTGMGGVGALKFHNSPHVNGRKALGGNLVMCDNHVEWRKLGFLHVGSIPDNSGPVPAFWW